MPLIISIIYAPIIVFLLKSYAVVEVAIFILLCSICWFLISLFQTSKAFIYPMVYMLLSLVTLKIQTIDLLKVLPWFISFSITIAIFYSYVTKKSVIIYFAKRFMPHKINRKEEEYIQSSTLLWLTFSVINTIIHGVLFFHSNIQWWVWYSSIGWYGCFILAGMIQFLHRHFVFLRRFND